LIQIYQSKKIATLCQSYNKLVGAPTRWHSIKAKQLHV